MKWKWLVLLCFLFFCFSNALFALDIQQIGNQEVDEGQTLQIPIEAISGDGPVQFEIVDPPQGARLENERQIDQDHFACDFVWTPSFDQAGNYKIIIAAKDKGGAISEKFKVKVQDVNRPPDAPSRPNPSDGEAVYYDDKLILYWDGGRDADSDGVEFLVEVWRQGPKKDPLVAAYTKDTLYEITIIFPAANYMWRVTAIDEHGDEKKSPIWKFTVSQWFKINIDSTVFVLLIRKPGEYTLKWTNVKIQSNGNLGLCFKPTDAEGPNGERIQISYGIKEKGDIVWHDESWVMKITLPQAGYTFELYAKIKIEPKHSSGLYQGKLRLNVAMINQGGEE